MNDNQNEKRGCRECKEVDIHAEDCAFGRGSPHRFSVHDSERSLERHEFRDSGYGACGLLTESGPCGQLREAEVHLSDDVVNDRRVPFESDTGRIGGDREHVRVEPIVCPRCNSSLHTRVVNKSQLYCANCGEWSNTYDSPSNPPQPQPEAEPLKCGICGHRTGVGAHGVCLTRNCFCECVFSAEAERACPEHCEHDPSLMSNGECLAVISPTSFRSHNCGHRCTFPAASGEPRIRRREESHDDPCISLYCGHNRGYHVPQCAFSGCNCQSFEKAPTTEEAEAILRKSGIDSKQLANEFIDYLGKRHFAVCDAARALTEKLRTVHNDSRYQGAWATAQLLQGQYDGPQYDKELSALESVLAAKTTEAETPLTVEAARALQLYTPPFRYDHGFIWDAKNLTVADDEGQDVALRIRGWGHISYKPDPEKLQDAVGELIAQALTEFWAQHTARIKP